MSIKDTRPARLRARTQLPGPAKAPDHIGRIAAITRNARTTWLSLLGVLLFVGVTLLGFEHIDFYGYNRQTQLPLIGVSVPTPFFFYAAPLLVAANYIYFHLYLIRLWDALGQADAQIDGAPLGHAVPPWLVTDAALWLRNWRQNDGCTDQRPLEGVAAILTLALTWGFGLIIGIMSWWYAAVARDVYMTGLAAIALTAMILAALASFGAMWQRMARNAAPKRTVLAGLSALIIGAALGFPTYYRTTEPAPWMTRLVNHFEWNDETQMIEKTLVDFPVFAHRDTELWDRFFTLAEIDLVGENIVERPANWLPYDISRSDYRREWCAREAKQDCNDFGEDEERFDREFWTRQRASLVSLQRPGWHGRRQTKPDLRGANLQYSFLAGLNLASVRMQGADLYGAQMQAVDLFDAQMAETNLRSAVMQGATLRNAKMRGADLSFAEMQGATLRDAHLHGADLLSAQLQGAGLAYARMPGAILSRANVRGANFQGARLQGADFSRAQMQNASLVGAQIQSAILRDAEMQEAVLQSTNMRRAILNSAKMQGVDLRYAWMQGAQLSGTQMQGANLGFAKMMGATLNGAQMNGAVLEFAILTDHTEVSALKGTSLDASTNDGGALKDVDLSDIRFDAPFDWRNTFLDGSVEDQDRLLEGMNLASRPCQWQTTILDDQAFFSHWRGWIDANPDNGPYKGWNNIGPEGWEDVTPIPPPPGCTWATDPLPGMPD